MQHYQRINTPLGPMLAAAENEALTGLWFAWQKHFPADAGSLYENRSGTDIPSIYTPSVLLDEKSTNHPVMKSLTAWLSAYFSGDNPEIDFKLEPRGTEFQKAVWERLLTIPYGNLATYGGIAAEIAAARASGRVSARAVGQAVGHNPISILIPCHRVIGAGGRLTGYAGGLERKIFLLKMEKADLHFTE